MTGTYDIEVDATTFGGRGTGTGVRAGPRTSGLRVHGAPSGTWQRMLCDDPVSVGARREGTRTPPC